LAGVAASFAVALLASAMAAEQGVSALLAGVVTALATILLASTTAASLAVTLLACAVFTAIALLASAVFAATLLCGITTTTFATFLCRAYPEHPVE
jgi:hypothetical protein